MSELPDPPAVPRAGQEYSREEFERDRFGATGDQLRAARAGQERSDEEVLPGVLQPAAVLPQVQNSSLSVQLESMPKGEVAPPLDALRGLLERWQAEVDRRRGLNYKGAEHREQWAGGIAYALECCIAELQPLVEAADAERTALRELLIEQTRDEAGPDVEYCWYCHNDINGKSTGEKRPHADDCWLMRVRAELTRLRPHEDPRKDPQVLVDGAQETGV